MDPAAGGSLVSRIPLDRFDVTASAFSPQRPPWLDDLNPDIVLIACTGASHEMLRACEAVERWTDRPVVALVERSDEVLLARVLEAGIDEYLPLSTSDQELFARIEALVRRAHRNAGVNGVKQIGALTLSPSDQSVTLGDRKVSLSPIQFRLLVCLASAPGRVLTHQTLMSRVWGAEYVDSRHYLRLYIRYLREKLEDDPNKPRIILSEWGVGYRFEPPLAAPVR
jgi:two-component system KDP operon response regulator KdpE